MKQHPSNASRIRVPSYSLVPKMFPRSLGLETKHVSKLYIFESHMCVIWVFVVGLICNCSAADY
jgi:hypothetical protein